MRKLPIVIGMAFVLIWESIAHAHPINRPPKVEISISGGSGAVYLPGDTPDLWIISDEDCYVMVYEIDSDGYLRVLYPRSPYQSGFIRGGRAYRICRPGCGRYYVSGPPGVVYVHVLASPRPFRRVYWEGCDGYARLSIGVSWDNFGGYMGCVLPPRVYGDPYVAMQTIDEFICLDMVREGIVWADFTYFYVGHRVDYPRYLCYDCHGFRCPFDPYVDVCLRFTINIVNPRPACSTWCWWWWCTPKKVYCGPRYVCIEKHSKYWDRPQRSNVYKWKSRMEPSHSVENSIRGEMVSLDRGSPERFKGGLETLSEKGLYRREEVRETKSQAERERIVKRDAQAIQKAWSTRAPSIVNAVLEGIGRDRYKRSQADNRAITQKGKEARNDAMVRRSESSHQENRVAPSVRTRDQRGSQTKRRGVSR